MPVLRGLPHAIGIGSPAGHDPILHEHPQLGRMRKYRLHYNAALYERNSYGFQSSQHRDVMVQGLLRTSAHSCAMSSSAVRTSLLRDIGAASRDTPRIEIRPSTRLGPIPTCLRGAWVDRLGWMGGCPSTCTGCAQLDKWRWSHAHAHCHITFTSSYFTRFGLLMVLPSAIAYSLLSPKQT